MAFNPANARWLLRGLPLLGNGRLGQAWVDLSLRTKLLLFAFCLVTLPGAVFALVAFSSAREALEREVGIQLHQTAEQGADALASALERAHSDARSWASQDLMRDLVVGDLDKRVSRFLQTIKNSKATYLEVLCVDQRGHVVAASSGDWLDQDVGGWGTMVALRNAAESLVGPTASPHFKREILEIGVAIENPDPPGGRIGSLILIYDWAGMGLLLDSIRLKLANLGKRVAALVVDREGQVISSTPLNGWATSGAALSAERWQGSTSAGYRKRRVGESDGSSVEFLVGAASISDPPLGWSVLFIEPTTEALAPVRRVRERWIAIITGILLVALAVAALLGREVMRPLDEVTRATGRVASQLDQDVPMLPVRSRNEIGQLAQSFNKMTVELKKSQEEALAAAKLASAGELAAIVAHEVRTPLSVMRSSAQMLADPTPSRSTDNTELVETIVAEVDRIERVVTGLLELARPVEQRFEPTWLRDLLARASDFVAAQAATQQVRIQRDFAALEQQAFCDPEQIYQVVLNLLVNALQALPEGGCIRLRTLPEDSGTVSFEVGDDGPGLPPEIRDRIFRPFVTGREEGTGLGLAFVERIVKANRGSVSIRSEIKQGTAFQVKLPAAQVTA